MVLAACIDAKNPFFLFTCHTVLINVSCFWFDSNLVSQIQKSGFEPSRKVN